MIPVKEILAVNIKLLRRKWGYSQEKLAETTDLSAQTISDIEGCRTWVSDKTLEKLAIALKVDIFQFFMPQDDNDESDKESVFYNRLMKLRTSMKEDIDKRLDQFYISEKSLS